MLADLQSRECAACDAHVGTEGVHVWLHAGDVDIAYLKPACAAHVQRVAHG